MCIRDRVRDQVLLLAQPERRPVEPLEMTTRVTQIALDPHRAEQNPADDDLWGAGHELVFDGAAIAYLGHDRLRRSPFEANRLAGSVPDRESDAFVHGIRQEIHDASATCVEVYLHDVP